MDETKQDIVKDDVRKIVELSIDDILPNRFQPRIKFDDSAIFELSESIKIHGVFQPIIVRPLGDKYEIIAGERRYKASVLAGKATVPAIIMNINDSDTVEIALIENVQRADLTPIEEAISYKKILDMGYINQEALARKLGKSQSTIANKLRLLNLADEVQEALLDNKISERHARSLLKLKDFQDQKNMLEKIISQKLTVRKTDEEIKNMLNNDQTNPFNNLMNVPTNEPTDVANPFDNAINMTANVAPVQPVMDYGQPQMVNPDTSFVQPVSSAIPVEPAVGPVVAVDPMASQPTQSVGINDLANQPAMPSSPIYNFSDVNNQVFNPTSIDTGVINSSVISSGIDNNTFKPETINNVDVGNIEANATDFNTVKPVAPMNDLLMGSTPVTQDVAPSQEEAPESLLKPGKFFNFPSEPVSTTPSVDYNESKNFNFNNLYNNSFVSVPTEPVNNDPVMPDFGNQPNAFDSTLNIASTPSTNNNEINDFNSFTFTPVAPTPVEPAPVASMPTFDTTPTAPASGNQEYETVVKMLKNAIQFVSSKGYTVIVNESNDANEYKFNIVIPK